MFVFWKIWHALFSCYLRLEIRSFALLPTNCRCENNFLLDVSVSWTFVETESRMLRNVGKLLEVYQSYWNHSVLEITLQSFNKHVSARVNNLNCPSINLLLPSHYVHKVILCGYIEHWKKWNKNLVTKNSEKSKRYVHRRHLSGKNRNSGFSFTSSYFLWYFLLMTKVRKCCFQMESSIYYWKISMYLV